MGAYLAKWEPIWEPISRNAHLGKWDYFPNGHFVFLLRRGVASPLLKRPGLVSAVLQFEGSATVWRRILPLLVW